MKNAATLIPGDTFDGGKFTVVEVTETELTYETKGGVVRTLTIQPFTKVAK